MKLVVIAFLTLFVFSCAPHSHKFKLIENNLSSDNINQILVGCRSHNKTFLVDVEGKDSVYLYSESLLGDEFKPLELKDSIFGSFTYDYRIKDNRFHKLLINDTLILKIKNEKGWSEVKYVVIPDGYIEN